MQKAGEWCRANHAGGDPSRPTVIQLDKIILAERASKR